MGVHVNTYGCGEELVKALEEDCVELPDLLILDIYMAGLDGIQTAEKARRLIPSVLIVYLTTSREDVWRAIQTHDCFDYILKEDLQYERIKKLLHDVTERVGHDNTRIRIASSGEDVWVRLNEICYITTDRHYVRLTDSGGEMKTYRVTFSEVLKTLSVYPQFLECNRGILVNMNHASSMDREVIVMDNGEMFPLARKQSRHLLDTFNRYQFSRLEKQLGNGGRL